MTIKDIDIKTIKEDLKNTTAITALVGQYIYRGKPQIKPDSNYIIITEISLPVIDEVHRGTRLEFKLIWWDEQVKIEILQNIYLQVATEVVGTDKTFTDPAWPTTFNCFRVTQTARKTHIIDQNNINILITDFIFEFTS